VQQPGMFLVVKMLSWAL